MNLRPLNDTILFQFLDETGGAKGRFTERHKGSIIIPTLNSNQSGVPRWAKAIAVGPKVNEVTVGMFIMIEPLQWTTHEVFEGEKVWKTTESKVFLSTDNEEDTLTF